MTSWKLAEKEVARYFGGTRRVRIMYSEEIGDIIHPEYSIEVKYGKQVPEYCMTDDWLSLNGYQLYPSRLGKSKGVIKSKRKSTKFLDDAMAQAERYDLSKEPIVCLKSKGMRGFIICRRTQRLEDALGM